MSAVLSIIESILGIGAKIRYGLLAIPIAPRAEFVAKQGKSMRLVVSEKVRRLIAYWSPVLGRHVCRCRGSGQIHVVAHLRKARCWRFGRRLTTRCGMRELAR